MAQSVLVNMPASNVTVADVGRYFDSDTVEDVSLQYGRRSFRNVVWRKQ